MTGIIASRFRRILVACAAWQSRWYLRRFRNHGKAAWTHRAVVSGAEALAMNTELRPWL